MENKRDRKQRSSPAAMEAQRLRQERLRREKAEKQRAAEEKEVRKERESGVERRQRQQKTQRRERDSRAAQTAQRQRKERKEDSRLADLRQKQKKEAKHRTKRRLSPLFWKRLIIISAVAAAVLLTLTLFFRVQHIDVVGNQFYTAEEIALACGTAEGDNLLTISRGEVAGNIIAKCEYVESVRVTRVLPNRLVLTVTEYPASYAVVDVKGDYYLITADGKVVGQTDERQAKTHIMIEELTIKTPVTGDVAVIASEDTEAASKLRFDALLSLLQEIERAELVNQISSVHVASAYDISLRYTDRFEVELGSYDALDRKLAYLKAVIAEQKDYDTGVIDLTFRDGERAYVKLNE